MSTHWKRPGRRKKLTVFVMFLTCLLFCVCFTTVCAVTSESVTKWSKELSETFQKMFESATKFNKIDQSFRNLADPEVFDPATEVKIVKRRIENYFRERAKMAWDAKVSLESKLLISFKKNEVNDPYSKNFVRYLNAKSQSDESIVYTDGHLGEMIRVNSTRVYNFRSNANYYNISTNSDSSAVHVPTPIYNRNPYLLERIQWSNIDQLYRRNREHLKDLSFQKFCSESGFMRYFPAAPWIYDSSEDNLDMFDCRSTEWFINAATMSKNVIILLDLSGSMLGQRLEIAKQTISSILETLSDNDFFNIIAFSKSINFLDNCVEEGLTQATMRNKKLILSRLSNITSEGKADYEKALSKAFTTLMNLPGTVFWRTKEEVAKDRDNDALDPNFHYVTLDDHTLLLSQKYMNAITKFTSNSKKMGCNDVIMLITDGAPGFFKPIFKLYNKEKRIRFFSFLVGEEATDFEEVRWMACNNRGFMAHINNLADVQEKVQHYVKVMSRSISRQSSAIHQENAIWSGSGRERTSNEFVITVSYPVVLDGFFMGVTAVSIPLTELAQIAHPVLAGGESYFFMLDNNGYAMFHPQLRPVDPVSGDVKSTFGNMDFVEIDFQTRNPPDVDLNCANTDIKLQDLVSLFSVDNMRRVYRVVSDYYVECIEGTNFMVGLSISGGDQARLKRANSNWDFTKIDMKWFKDNNWRLHPKWRYCLLNDSDIEISREAAFQFYARQMQETGELPVFCRSRRQLIDRLLLDLQGTSNFQTLWNLNSSMNNKFGVHLTFFASPSGLMRFDNRTLDGLHYDHPDRVSETEFAYRHFLLQLNARSADSDYFKRAVRQKNRIVFDINRKTHLWNGPGGGETSYGNLENETLLAYAYKALYNNAALVGVVGTEFLYEKFVEYMKSIGCLPDNDRTRCYLLDEHAYVIYTSQKDTFYSEYIKAFNEEMCHEVPVAVGNLAVAQRTHHKHIVHQHHTSYSQHRQQHKPQRKLQTHTLSSATPNQDFIGVTAGDGTVVLGHFFGQINRVAEWTMGLLLKKGFYKRRYFIDNQAMCDPELTPKTTTAGSSMFVWKPLKNVAQMLFWILSQLVFVLQHFSIVQISKIDARPSETTTLPSTMSAPPAPTAEGRFSCRKKSLFYLANPDYKPASSALLEENLSERPCKRNAAQCVAKVYASWVESTNLLLVVIRQGSRSQCYDSTYCPMSSPSEIPFGFHKITSENVAEESQEQDDDEDDESEMPCSGTGSAFRRWATYFVSILAVIFTLLLRQFNFVIN